MKTISLIIPLLAFSISAATAGGNQLEVRLLRMSGDAPNKKTLQSLVVDPGAQATPMISVPLSDSGEAKIRQVTPYRYAIEYTPKGEPDSFQNKDLGWTGSATVTYSGEDKVNLKLDLTNVRFGPPHIYDVKGVQVTMPVFTAGKIPDQEMVLTRGLWRFIKSTQGDDTYFWAVRVAKLKS